MAEAEEAEPQPDLVWDDQVRGLCVRIFGNGSKSYEAEKVVLAYQTIQELVARGSAGEH
jgi:hypothetical protein